METPQCASFSFPSLFQYWPTSENQRGLLPVQCTLGLGEIGPGDPNFKIETCTHFTFQLRRHFDYRKVCIATSVMISRSPNESEMDNHIQQLFAWQKARVKRLCHTDLRKRQTGKLSVLIMYHFVPGRVLLTKVISVGNCPFC